MKFTSRQVNLLAPLLLATGCVREGTAPAATSYVYESESVATIAAPFTLVDNALVKVTVYRDAVFFHAGGEATRSASMVQFTKATRDTAILNPIVSEPVERSGDVVRIRHSGVCIGIVPCPGFETGRIAGDTLFLTSRYANFTTIRYRRVAILPD